jgi:Serine carboxypeptidase S28
MQVWQGAIAGSAPIWTFYDETPEMDPLFYSKGVTFDTTEAAGAAPGCTDAIRGAFAAMGALSKAESGPAQVSDALRICPCRQLNSTADVLDTREWAAAAFDMMAMGNYPYASSYMLVRSCAWLAAAHRERKHTCCAPNALQYSTCLVRPSACLCHAERQRLAARLPDAPRMPSNDGLGFPK